LPSLPEVLLTRMRRKAMGMWKTMRKKRTHHLRGGLQLKPGLLGLTEAEPPLHEPPARRAL